MDDATFDLFMQMVNAGRNPSDAFFKAGQATGQASEGHPPGVDSTFFPKWQRQRTETGRVVPMVLGETYVWTHPTKFASEASERLACQAQHAKNQPKQPKLLRQVLSHWWGTFRDVCTSVLTADTNGQQMFLGIALTAADIKHWFGNKPKRQTRPLMFSTCPVCKVTQAYGTRYEDTSTACPQWFRWQDINNTEICPACYAKKPSIKPTAQPSGFPRPAGPRGTSGSRWP